MVSGFEQPQPLHPTAELHQLAAGASGIVAALQGHEATTTKLAEAGFVPGALVRLVRRAPLGSPLEVEVDGARFTLRSEDAAAVLLRPADSTHA
jgi:Fe2+ transport system protein FeoA